MRGEGTKGGKVLIICDAHFSLLISITGHTDRTLLVQHVLKVKPVEDDLHGVQSLTWILIAPVLTLNKINNSLL